MTLKEILSGESKNLEFKVQRPKDSSKYMKSVVAFANGDGGMEGLSLVLMTKLIR